MIYRHFYELHWSLRYENSPHFSYAIVCSYAFHSILLIFQMLFFSLSCCSSLYLLSKRKFICKCKINFSFWNKTCLKFLINYIPIYFIYFRYWFISIYILSYVIYYLLHYETEKIKHPWCFVIMFPHSKQGNFRKFMFTRWKDRNIRICHYEQCDMQP